MTVHEFQNKVRRSSIHNRQEPMGLLRSIMDLNTVNLNFIPKHHLAWWYAAHPVSGRARAMGTRHTTQPGNCFEDLLFGSAKFRKPFQVGFARVAQVTMNLSESLLKFPPFGDLKTDPITVQPCPKSRRWSSSPLPAATSCPSPEAGISTSSGASTMGVSDCGSAGDPLTLVLSLSAFHSTGDGYAQLFSHHRACDAFDQPGFAT